MSKKIGFIGLGNMGAPMAANLAKAGHSVTGYDVAGTTAEGVTAARNLESAVAGMDVVITMLPNGSILRQVRHRLFLLWNAAACLWIAQPWMWRVRRTPLKPLRMQGFLQ